MNEQNQSLQDLQHIKKMMERSSRFISLSGWSGISAGVCALLGAAVAQLRINSYLQGLRSDSTSASYYRGETYTLSGSAEELTRDLVMIAGITFIAALSHLFCLPGHV